MAPVSKCNEELTDNTVTNICKLENNRVDPTGIFLLIDTITMKPRYKLQAVLCDRQPDQDGWDDQTNFYMLTEKLKEDV